MDGGKYSGVFGIKVCYIILMKQASFEIEYRARFDQETHNRLHAYLENHAEDLGEDDKDTYFFIFPDKLLKVVNNISKDNAEIVLKLNKIGEGSHFDERCIEIDRNKVDDFVYMFKLLGFNHIIRSLQKRHNYIIDSVEVALKYSSNWGYHAELEVIVDNLDLKPVAEEKIKKIAKLLDIQLMGDKELKEFTKKIEDGALKK